jgi:1,2-diacylglycerol 3-beta-galactosyltransferase
MVVSTGSRVLLYLVDAGGGHRAAANALVAAAEAAGAPLRFELVSLQRVLDAFDFTRRLTGRSAEESYNELLRTGRTRLMVPMLRALQWCIARLHARLARRLAEDLAARPRADLVVSLAPNFNGPIRDAVRAAWPGVPFAVHLTDWADFPPDFWMVPGLDAVLVGSDAAVAQARNLGFAGDRIVRLSGMVLSPRFHRVEADARTTLRAELAVPGNAFLVMLLVGGKGTARMAPLAERLVSVPELRVIAVCGENPRLLARVKDLERRSNGRLLALGFTDRVAPLLAASDLLVTKPGPASLAEAFQMGVPVVITADAATIPQERFNARFVAERGLGVVARRWDEVPGIVATLAREPQRLARMQEAVRALPRNQAVDEALAAYRRLAAQPAGAAQVPGQTAWGARGAGRATIAAE